MGKLPALIELDISQCEVDDVQPLVPLLNSGRWSVVRIPCIGGDPFRLGNYLHARVVSQTEVTFPAPEEAART